MCRLFAWHSPSALTPAEALGEDKPNLIELSRLHEDGWGMAWCDEHGNVQRHRDESAAFQASTIDVAKSTDAILHLRWATEAIPVCIPNTHPFVKTTPLGEMAFIHNGGIERGTTLRGLISDPLFNSLEGEGDSEQYFAAIITNLQSNGGDLVGAYQKFLTDVQEVRYSSLNAFLLTSDHLFIVAAFKPENRPPSQPADYYDLSWRSENGCFSAWSSGVRSGVGTPVANYSLMQVERATGEVTTRPLR